jgi:membrane protein implicated in regulation of membrane protease activity
MHHLLLLLPVFALVLFCLLPWPLALTVYLPILIGSLFAYGKAIQAQRLPRTTGEESMVGKRAVAIRSGVGAVEVMFHGEIWHALSSEPLQEGQEVVIEKVDGLTLRVRPAERRNTVS